MSAGDRLDASVSWASLQESDRRAGARFCRRCGCTDAYACADGCGWVDEDLCSACADAGPELPDYPPLPVVDGALVLDRLEACSVELARRGTELGAALLLVDAGVAPAGDHDVVLARMGHFERRRRSDMAWAAGFVVGRFAAVVGGLPTLAPAAATAERFRAGREAGRAAAARAMAEAGRR
ncbi:MAG: hypothetical protein ACLGIO_09080 [Acidimicrobiia bacterium]